MRQGAAGPAATGAGGGGGQLERRPRLRRARRPGAGETLHGTAFDVYTGGKGANQALAAARAGGLVSLVGRTGEDPFGAQLRAALEADGVDLRHTGVDAEAGTGVAGIVVEPDGSNSIVVVSRANGRLGPAGRGPRRRRHPGGGRPPAAAGDAPRSRRSAARLAREARADGGAQSGPRPYARSRPGPAGGFADLLRLTDIVVPNETEAAAADRDRGGQPGGRGAGRAGPAGGRPPGGADHPRRPRRGAGRGRAARRCASPPFDVHVVDTTAAGDAFCGALAVALARGPESAPGGALRGRRRGPRRDRRRGRAFAAPAPGDRAPRAGPEVDAWMPGAATASQPPLNTKPGPESVDYEAQVAARGRR